jgi:hypothetical protein
VPCEGPPAQQGGGKGAGEESPGGNLLPSDSGLNTHVLLGLFGVGETEIKDQE